MTTPDGVERPTINDGKDSAGVIVNAGSSAPNLFGVFNDKTSIAADRTTSRDRGNVYFAWSRFTGNAVRTSMWSGPPTMARRSRRRAADHRRERHPGPRHRHPRRRPSRSPGTRRPREPLDSVNYSVSTNGGATWSTSRTVTIHLLRRQDVAAPTAEAPSLADFEGATEEAEAAGNARDCGVLDPPAPAATSSSPHHLAPVVCRPDGPLPTPGSMSCWTRLCRGRRFRPERPTAPPRSASAARVRSMRSSSTH